VRVVKETFDAFPEVDCLGGRTLPIWSTPPPRWLTPLHWVGPLALQDYGDTPFVIDAQRPLCLAGANFAFRRSLFSRIGLFSPAFPRGQDTQLVVRMLMAGGRAMYVPGMLVHAPVAAERLTKTYHRRWHRNVGHCNARMGLEELSDSVLGLRPSTPDVSRAWGIPLFAVRQLGSEIALWLRDTLARRPPEAFLHETRVHKLIGYVRESYALRGRGASAALESASGPSFADAPAGLPAKLET
jgi:GT2 family glycosyltransferase